MYYLRIVKYFYMSFQCLYCKNLSIKEILKDQPRV